MAILRIGKLKFRFKDGGIDYRWGDGEKRRFALGKKASNAEDENQYGAYDEQEAQEYEYSGRFGSVNDGEDYDPAYDDEEYEENPEEYWYDDVSDEEGQYDDQGYDDRYDDRGYGEDGYDDGQYDDQGYNDGYDDQDYDDGYYDDRYSDEDADDGYYDEYDEEYPEQNPVLAYVDDNPWVTYLLLFLLPPVGIALLWWRNRFEPRMKYILTGVSVLWMILLIFLMTMLFGGRKEDPNSHADPVLPSVSPTVSATVTPKPTVTPAATQQTSGVKPSATPIGGVVTTQQPTNTLVYASSTGRFYHESNTCEVIETGENVVQVTLANAQSRKLYACPGCYDDAIYYATTRGKWYHLDPNCSDMTDPEVYSKAMAEEANKPACPVCVTKTQESLYDTSNVKFINTSTTDKSGIEVWCTSSGTWYHLTKDCRGMENATKGKLRDALLMGKTACPTCCAASGTPVYCTKNGTYYHATATCSKMENAQQVSLAEALVLGKKQCNVCQPSTSVPGGSNQGTAAYYVYARPDGTYYHVNSSCSGMKNAQKVSLSSMLDAGRPACPECCAGADMTVYAAQGGTYYHSYATCSNMTNAVQGTLSQALAMGYQRCTKCWGTATGGSTGEAGGNATTNNAASATADTVMVYATQGGKHYHTISNCTGMQDASRISLRLAITAGKTACSNCAAAALMQVYSTDGGTWYHSVSDCQRMTGAKQRTLADALMLGQTACPTCMKNGVGGIGAEDGAGEGSGDDASVSGTIGGYVVGTSGIKVYAEAEGKYFHTTGSCSGKTGMTQVALEVALNYGKSACPTCAASAASTVYATQNGRYYHVSQSCAGEGAVPGTLADALAYGFVRCPYCVTSSQSGQQDTLEATGGYTVGTSGVKVYATVDGAYYHASKSCAGSSAVQITLETALNYGKKGCSICCAAAETTVYGVAHGTTYHANKSCAGSGAVGGTLAHAMALGLTPCSNCIGSGNSGFVSGGVLSGSGAAYTAPAGSTVYVDLYSDQFYYHINKSCSDFGMTNGTAQTLEFAKDLGYTRCPYCNPPSDMV